MISYWWHASQGNYGSIFDKMLIIRAMVLSARWWWSPNCVTQLKLYTVEKLSSTIFCCLWDVRHQCHPTKSPLFPIYTGIQALCWPNNTIYKGIKALFWVTHSILGLVTVMFLSYCSNGTLHWQSLTAVVGCSHLLRACQFTHQWKMTTSFFSLFFKTIKCNPQKFFKIESPVESSRLPSLYRALDCV